MASKLSWHHVEPPRLRKGVKCSGLKASAFRAGGLWTTTLQGYKPIRSPAQVQKLTATQISALSQRGQKPGGEDCGPERLTVTAWNLGHFRGWHFTIAEQGRLRRFVMAGTTSHAKRPKTQRTCCLRGVTEIFKGKHSFFWQMPGLSDGLVGCAKSQRRRKHSEPLNR